MLLREALGVPPGGVVAVVGGGGKTSVLFRLGQELAQAGGVIITGTTKFTPSRTGEVPPTAVADDLERLLGQAADGLGQHRLIVCASGQGEKGRFIGIDPAWVEHLRRLPGVRYMLVNADGSAGRPFKAPAAHEPVVPPCASLVCPIVGVDAVGRTLNEKGVHRPQAVARLTGAPLGATITLEMVARVLLHPEGGRKGVPAGARFVPIVNKADLPGGEATAHALAALLLEGGAEAVVIAQALRQPPALAVVTRP
ncbi:MAG: selenium cofactor biosynthesis protein YqeC [Dehalococcoidia bacterium]